MLDSASWSVDWEHFGLSMLFFVLKVLCIALSIVV